MGRREEATSSGLLMQAKALTLARKIMDQECEAIHTLGEELDNKFWECAQLLSNCSGLIWVTGVGTSAAIGMRFAHILTCCGTRAMFLSPSEGLHGHAGVMSSNDLLVAMSRGGKSGEVNQMINTANQHRIRDKAS